MASTHVSLHVHTVFSTKERYPFIESEWRERLHAYIGGTLRGLGATPLEIGGIDDHVHILAGLKPTQAVAEIVREVKKASTVWVHDEIGRTKFRWQDGYGAFAVSKRDIDAVREYIRNQEEHHRSRTFQEEYLDLLKELGIAYDERYVW
jgi:REP element-mobilizing transposase RayT